MELAVRPCCLVPVCFCGSYSLSNFLSSKSWLSCTNRGVSLGFIQKDRIYPSHLKRWDSVQIGSLVYCCRRKEPWTFSGWNFAGNSTIFGSWRSTKIGRVWYAIVNVGVVCKKSGFWRDTGLFTDIPFTLGVSLYITLKFSSYLIENTCITSILISLSMLCGKIRVVSA